ncbi:MAG: DNA polymerase I [Erysipelothrix sp.]|nr:DNA polymerase I [Erysipelothrix sp.]
MNKILLVDGNSLLFRAYYATAFGRIQRTSYGKYTNAVTAFDSMLTNVISELKPKYIIIAFDTRHKTFRHDMFEDYKGHRSSAPEELVEQFETVRELIDAANYPRIEIKGFEADDIIGSYAKQNKDNEVIILTSDQDMLQLVDAETSVYLMKKGTSAMDKVTSENFKELYEVEPSQIIDLKAMQGDAADNIPGIPGIGKVTALKLVKEYGNLENLLANTDKLKGKQKENVENNVEIAKLSKVLATIKTDIEIEQEIEPYLLDVNYPNLYNFYRQYEMTRQADALQQYVYDDIEENTFEFEIVEKISPKLLNEDSFFFANAKGDYGKQSLDRIAISNGEITQVIYPEFAKVDKNLLAYLADENTAKTTYDVKKLYHLFDNEEIAFAGVKDDLKLAAFLSDNLVVDWTSFNTKYGGSIFELDHDEVSDETLAQNSSELLKFSKTILDEIIEKDMIKLYREVELPLTKLLFDMEKTGIKVDRKIIVDIADKTKIKIDELSKQIFAITNKEFNINSPKQLSEVLFDDLGLPMIKKRSTAVDVLEKLKDQHEIIGLIMQQRKYQKLYSTYAEGLQKFIGDDERIHTIYNQTIAQTGRLSSTDPNLQNISVRDEESRQIRKAFVADEGSVLMAYDYSQIELRLLAHLANVEKLINAFNNNLDIHEQTARDVFGIEEVDAHSRHLAKAVNFGIIYGISDFGLSEQLGITVGEAKTYISKYLETYPEIKQYMDETIAECEENGYVSTILNRRREIPEIKSSNFMVKSFGKRAAMNAPIQGSAADLIKVAMNRINDRMLEKNLKSKMLLQVHDELIFNVLNEEVEVMREIIEYEMTNAMELQVPLKSDGSTALDWYSL